MSGKIRLIKKIVDNVDNKLEKISLKRKEVSLDFHHIKNNFYDPIICLIENDGLNGDGLRIADMDGLKVIADILNSILYDVKNESGGVLGPIEIIEKIVLEELEKEVEINLAEESTLDEEIVEETAIAKSCIAIDDDERGYEEEEEEDEDEGDENEAKIEDSLEDWENLEEYRECDQYLENAVEDSMDDY
jgi:hypothetical protein